MKIIVGLGNPGNEYAKTKHNVGFMTLDVLAEKLGVSVSRSKFKGLVGEGRVGFEKVILLKPQTYMNLSGESVREAVNFYKIPAEDLIVIYDDIDIPLGTLRIRAKGSAGTHNGMRSVVQQLGDDGFPRIRVGIGGERKQEQDLVNYVISGFSGDDRERMRAAIEKAAEAAECIVTDGVSTAMNRFNTKKKKKKKKAEAAEAAETGATEKTGTTGKADRETGEETNG